MGCFCNHAYDIILKLFDGMAMPWTSLSDMIKWQESEVTFDVLVQSPYVGASVCSLPGWHSADNSNEFLDLHTTQITASEVGWGAPFSGHWVATSMFAWEDIKR